MNIFYSIKGKIGKSFIIKQPMQTIHKAIRKKRQNQTREYNQKAVAIKEGFHLH